MLSYIFADDAIVLFWAIDSMLVSRTLSFALTWSYHQYLSHHPLEQTT